MNVPIDISRTTLRTKRLILRPWKQSDLDDFYEYASVDGVGQMAGWQPHASKEVTQAVLDSFIKGRKTFALEYQGKVIGSLGIEEYNEEVFPEFAYLDCRELGFVLAKDCWGQGLMCEAVNETVRFLFEEMQLDLILCGYFLFNERSKRVQEKCGFKFYRYGKYETRMGDIVDDAHNILARVDWEESHGGGKRH